MPNPPNVGGVVGTDNVSPIYNPNGRWQVWNMEEIYLGQTAANKYVPKVNDVIFDIVGRQITRYIVKDINPTTMVAILQIEDETNESGIFSEEDILLGVGPGTQSDTYRIYLDQSVSPYRLSVDARLKVAGTMCRWCKLFRGSDVSASGIVISRMYDGNGVLTSENIPLELAATELLTNHAIKVVSSAYTNTSMLNGELVTAVFYDDAGYVVSKRQLLVENTGFIRSTDADKKYIISIGLESPFINVSTPRLIQYPINVPLNGLNLKGVVTYSNGEVRKYVVDGTKFTIFGFEQYIATQANQRINLVLKYALDSNEVAYNAVVGENHISEAYEAVTLISNSEYNNKLYGYPVWIDAVNGYRIEWFMYNLNRNIHYNVTPYVTINTNTAAFNPIAYGQIQRLSVSINLRDVNGSFANYIHTQTIDFALARPGTDRETNWTVGFTPDQSPRYGVDTYAAVDYLNANDWTIKLSAGQTTLTQWLEKVYLRTMPLVNPATEVAALTPTHFAVLVGAQRHEYPISQWNATLAFVGTIANSSSLFIEFIKKTNVNDLHLSIASMIVYHVDNTGIPIA